MKKFKALTLIEVIVVVLIVVVLACIILPQLMHNPKGEVVAGILVAIVIIVFAAIYVIAESNFEKNVVLITASVAVVALGITGVVGYNLLKTNLTYGEIVGYSWDREIIIEKSYYDDGEKKYKESRRIQTQGNDRSPYWGEYELKSNERTGKKNENYYFAIKNDEGITDYSCSYEEWRKHNIGDNIEFEYQKYKKYITNVY